MKNKFKLLFLSSLMVIGLGATNTSAENTLFWWRPNSVSFKGESKKWHIIHRMYLKGTEIEFDTKIIYKGNMDKLKNSRSFHYSISYGSGSYGGEFSLKDSNEFQSKRMPCGGCKYLDKEKEVTVTIHIDENDEDLILKRE